MLSLLEYPNGQFAASKVTYCFKDETFKSAFRLKDADMLC